MERQPLIVTAAAGTLGAAALMTYAVRGRSSALLAPSVYRGARDRRAIALTFDDGPSESTLRLLDVLARYNIRATFFECGRNVRRLPHVTRRVAEAGHEIGNHTDSHPKLHFKSPEFIERELTAAQYAIEDATGISPRLFRAPYGMRWFGLRRAQRRLGLLGVMWTTIGVDWKWPAGRVARRLLEGAMNGAIFCLHDGRAVEPDPDIGVTLEAVRRVAPVLLDQGFHFEKVSEILCPTN
jgi:peptidoglycan-N-acetylglucosamine deacetylase